MHQHSSVTLIHSLLVRIRSLEPYEMWVILQMTTHLFPSPCKASSANNRDPKRLATESPETLFLVPAAKLNAAFLVSRG